MIHATSSPLQHRAIEAGRGKVLGVNMVHDCMAGIRDIVGGRKATCVRELSAAAIPRAGVDHAALGRNHGRPMPRASGTAVRLKPWAAKATPDAAGSPWTHPAG